MKFPGVAFFLFGAGERRKLLYRAGVLYDLFTGEIVRQWDRVAGEIEPSEYRVEIQCRRGDKVRIVEDEQGVHIERDGRRETLTSRPVRLPRFEGHPNAPLLRRLNHEILVNIVHYKPLPNLLVYSRPWYRDAAMLLMCLHKTGNLDQVRPWVLSLREPFDRNNAGQQEPDNLGQALYMLSLVSDASHPLVRTILDIVPRFVEDKHLAGMSDFAPHPVYQTKWLKFGLRALHLPDAYVIPPVYDSYSALFWMDYKREHVEGKGIEADENSPYLTWAEAHFRQAPPPLPLNETQYPLTWEANASQADYARMKVISPDYVAARLAAPHTWHAAEIFLYYWNKGAGGALLYA